MNPTQVNDPEYYHKVVDCQYACPAHTPVPEYIRLIAAQKYTEAYMVNWESNVFPGVLGRTCDRPCEPACRRGRVEEEPVAICRLKRVAADNRGDIVHLLPDIPPVKNGKTIALIGGGPASLTVARDLAPLAYTIHLFDDQAKGGGMMRSQIPSFRLPETVLDQEVALITDLGIHTHYNHRVESLKDLIEQNIYDAIFIGTGAPKGKDLMLPGRLEGAQNIHIGIEWLASVAFEHVHSIGRRVIVLGGGNTAMDCCRTARRLGGEDVKVVVRSPYNEMKASPWEKEDAQHEDIPILDNHVPIRFNIENGRLTGITFEKVEAVYEAGKRKLKPMGEAPVTIEADDVLIAIGQENTFPWIERDLGIDFDEWGMPMVDPKTFTSSRPEVFFGGDAALGPKNIITAVAQGHDAAMSIHLYCSGKDVVADRPPPQTKLFSTKMGIHEWSFDNIVAEDPRYIVPQADKKETLKDRKKEVELGFDVITGFKEAQRCLNCDVQTVFTDTKCIECDACMDICPTSCITFTYNEADESALREKLLVAATNWDQDILVSASLKTGKVMVKDEDVCLHCGLCAERCPTAAWDMQKFLYNTAKAYNTCCV